MNDPNGFSTFNGKYHLFYQYNPFQPKWAPPYWGHIVSDDLVSWERKPIALAPDTDYDREGCFSGTALACGDRHILAYTSVQRDVSRNENFQFQSIAVGDGDRYTKLRQNPVITGDNIPENFSKHDFRDPKIWKDEEFFYLLAANLDLASGQWQLIRFRSKDCTDWEYTGVFFCDPGIGEIWECPDYFAMDGTKVLLFSPQESEQYGGGICLSGTEIGGEFIPDTKQRLDYGTDFYAAQTVEAFDGRRVLIAWMDSWRADSYPANSSWRGLLTFPRELRLTDGRLYQQPIRELSAYYDEEIRFSGMVASPEPRTILRGRTMDLQISFHDLHCEEAELRFAQRNDCYLSVRFFLREKKLIVDRTHTEYVSGEMNKKEIYLDTGDGTELSFRVLLDRFSIELFAEEGRKTMTMLYFTEDSYDDISVLSKNGSCHIDLSGHRVIPTA